MTTIENDSDAHGRIVDNPLRAQGFVAEGNRSPRWFHRRLPGYEPTPLHDVPSLASRFGVGRVFVKDESSRLGLPAFKMLGASWACYRALSERLGKEPASWQTIDELRSAFSVLAPLTLATATDGNHGRAVARMARQLGFSSRIFVPANTVRPRIDAIAGEGAEVVVSSGGYDDAVAESAATADDRTIVISDTSWPGYDRVPRWVIEGYSTILEEVDEQLQASGVESPDAVMVPIGVGALAGAVSQHYRAAGRQGTKLIGVEPIGAACVTESALAGKVITLAGTQESIMAGLNCGTPSLIAWPTVSASFDQFVTVSDQAVVEAMRMLHGVDIESGESGAAALAALAALSARPKSACRASDTVVLLSTEGITDPEFFRRVVLGIVRTL